MGQYFPLLVYSYRYVSSPVDCKYENATRLEGACNATCDVRGRRTVRLIPVVDSPAKHGGKECEEEVEVDCMGECGPTTGKQQSVLSFFSRPTGGKDFHPSDCLLLHNYIF